MMKVYSDFNSMFNAQSGLNKDIGVFNYNLTDCTINKLIAPDGIDMYDSFIVAPEVRIENLDGLRDDDDPEYVRIVEVQLPVADEQIQTVILNKTVEVLGKYGLKGKAKSYLEPDSESTFGLVCWVRGGTPWDLYGDEKGDEVCEKMHKELTETIGRYLDQVRAEHKATAYELENVVQEDYFPEGLQKVVARYSSDDPVSLFPNHTFVQHFPSKKSL